MKGHVVEKGLIGEAGEGAIQAVNIERWAREAEAKEAGQSTVDTKAFTGRGTRRELRHWLDTLQTVEREMAELCATSKQAAHACGAYLVLHRRAVTGYTHLRWREHGGRKRHLLAHDVQDMVTGQTEAVRAWVADATTLAERLNARHLQVREALREIRRTLASRPQPLLPRSVSIFPGRVGDQQ